MKKAFTLVEVALAILIVSMLVLLCMPIINSQMRKTHEYSYFVAYKTLEKMASQILIYGDGDNLAQVSNPSEFEKNVFPAAIAESFDDYKNKLYTEPTIVANFTQYEFDCFAISRGNTELVDNYYGTALAASCTYVYTNANLPDRYGSYIYNISNLNLSDNYNVGGNNPAKNWCDALGNVTGYTSFYFCDNNSPYSPSNPYCQCIVVKDSEEHDMPPAGSPASSTTPFSVSISRSMIGSSDVTNGGTVSGGGNCSDGNIALNNPNVCCAAGFNYYNYSDKSCVFCPVGMFNDSNNSCCPDNSYYSPSIQKCVCNDGYILENTIPNRCMQNTNANACPPGYSKRDAVDGDERYTTPGCDKNPQFYSVARFCSAIADTWNVKDVDCDTFERVDDVYAEEYASGFDFYTDVYNAVKPDDDHIYSDIRATRGAFEGITPNIVLSNGIRIWFLGDRAATIPGLSYNPQYYTNKNQTVCKQIYDSDGKLVGEDACSSEAIGGYYCHDEAACFAVTYNEEGNPGNAKPEDARNCCANPDLRELEEESRAAFEHRSDPRYFAISGFTVFVDIDGEGKGSSTLWDDIFPFYISTDAHVYPGYPLNAENKAIGGNSSYLSTDVYYYETDANNRRKKRYVYKSIPMARALCLSRAISAYTPYCQNLGVFRGHDDVTETATSYITGDTNECNNKKCFIHVKNKVKFF